MNGQQLSKHSADLSERHELDSSSWVIEGVGQTAPTLTIANSLTSGLQQIWLAIKCYCIECPRELYFH